MKYELLESNVLKYQNESDFNKRDILFEAILADVTGLIYHRMPAYIKYTDQTQDAFQECCIALFECLNSFKPEMNIKFTTYFTFYIKWGLQRFKLNSRLITFTSHFEKKGIESPSINNIDGLRIKAELPSYNPFREIDNLDMLLDLDVRIRPLNLKQKKVIFLALSGIEVKEIAKELNMTGTNIYLLIKEALECLNGKSISSRKKQKSLTEKQKEEIRLVYVKGFPKKPNKYDATHLVKKYNVSKSLIYNALKDK